MNRDEEEAKPRKTEPVGVFYESNNWYAVAWCHLRNDYRNFRLDRVKKISLSDDSYTRMHPAIEELRKKNDNIEMTSITVCIDKQHAHSLYWDRDMFGFEKEEMEGDKMRMHFRCGQHRIMYFARWFMMFADMGNIEEPKSLKKELNDLLKAAALRTKKKTL